MKKLGILVVAAAFGLTGCVGQAPAPSPTGSGAPTDTSTYKQWKSWTTVADYEKQAGKTVPAYVDPPALAAKVTSGALPPAASRIPKDAQVVAGPDGVGQSGGTLQAGSLGGSDLLFEYPFSYNADQKTTSPNIIKSYEVNSTLTEYTMHLRDGMKWSDGVPFTADDWVNYYNDIGLNKEYAPQGISEFVTKSGPASITKIDDETFKYTFRDPYWNFPYVMSRLTPPFVPWHYMKDFNSMSADPAKLKAEVAASGLPNWQALWDAKLGGYADNPDTPTIFRWMPTSLPTASVKVFVRNPYYWKVDPAGNQLPYIDSVQSGDVSGDVLLVSALAGKVDFATGGRLGGGTNYATLKGQEPNGKFALIPTLHSAENFGTIMFNFGIKDDYLRKLFNDQNFRVALSLGTDRQQVNNILYNGLLTPSQWAPSDGAPYFGESDPYTKDTKYDPTTANKMLDALGSTMQNGTRVRPDGTPLKLTLFYNTGEDSQDSAKMGELLVAQWQKLGIGVVLKGLDMDTYGFASGETPGLFLGALGLQGELPFTIGQFESDKIFAPWSEWLMTGGKSGIEPPADFTKLFGLYGDFKTAANDAAATEIEKQILQVYAQNLWVVSLLKRPGVFPTANYDVVSARMGNMSNPMPKEPNYDSMETWFIKQ